MKKIKRVSEICHQKVEYLANLRLQFKVTMEKSSQVILRRGWATSTKMSLLPDMMEKSQTGEEI